MSAKDQADCIAVVEKDGSCKEMRKEKTGGCTLMLVFGILVIAGLVTIIALQSKMLKCLHKMATKKK